MPPSVIDAIAIVDKCNVEEALKVVRITGADNYSKRILIKIVKGITNWQVRLWSIRIYLHILYDQSVRHNYKVDEVLDQTAHTEWNEDDIECKLYSANMKVEWKWPFRYWG